MKFKVGDIIPDIKLKNEENKEIRLSDFRGRKVILSFHPLAFTPVCAQQMLDLEKHSADFKNFNTLAIGISVDSPFSKAAWKKELGLKNTLLASDFSKQIAQQLEILRPEGFSERAVYVIDEQGKVIFARLYPVGQVPDITEILKVVASR